MKETAGGEQLHRDLPKANGDVVSVAKQDIDELDDVVLGEIELDEAQGLEIHSAELDLDEAVLDEIESSVQPNQLELNETELDEIELDDIELASLPSKDNPSILGQDNMEISRIKGDFCHLIAFLVIDFRESYPYFQGMDIFDELMAAYLLPRESKAIGNLDLNRTSINTGRNGAASIQQSTRLADHPVEVLNSERDPRKRTFSEEFACPLVHIRKNDHHDEENKRRKSFTGELIPLHCL